MEVHLVCLRSLHLQAVLNILQVWNGSSRSAAGTHFVHVFPPYNCMWECSLGRKARGPEEAD